MSKKNDEQVNEKFGEMVPSNFKWLGAIEQKKRAEELERVTKKKG